MSDKELTREQWELDGTGKMTPAQRRMLNAVCGDLAAQVDWHGFRLSKDDWRHMLSGTMIGWRMVPGIDRGEGPSLIMLGGSSLDLSRTLAAEAITCGVRIGDDPSTQGLKSARVRWCDKVLMGLGYRPEEIRGAA